MPFQKKQTTPAPMELPQSPLTQPAKTTVVEDEQPVKKEAGKRDLGIDIVPGKTYVFETLRKSETPRHEILGAACKIFDPIEERIREIRYISSAASIFSDEQEKQDPELKNRPLDYVGFYHNQLVVDGEDKRKVEYLLMHDRYDGNTRPLSKEGPIFKLVDKEQYNIVEKKHHDRVLEALTLIEESKEEDLMPVSRIVFGIMDESETGTINKLRNIVMAPKPDKEQKSGAQTLLDNLNDPIIRRKYTIQQAIDKGVLKVEGDKVSWGGENGAYITTVSSRNNPRVQVNDINKFTLQTGDGEKFYKLLKEKAE